jgi:hypothetical protein
MRCKEGQSRVQGDWESKAKSVGGGVSEGARVSNSPWRRRSTWDRRSRRRERPSSCLDWGFSGNDDGGDSARGGASGADKNEGICRVD